MTRAALAATRHVNDGIDVEFCRAKIATARFFADHMLVTVPSIAESIVGGSVGTPGTRRSAVLEIQSPDHSRCLSTT